MRLYRVIEKPFREVAADLGVAPQSLRRWVMQAELDDGRAQGLHSDEREELRKLRRENARLKEERGILRKAATFFARDTEDPAVTAMVEVSVFTDPRMLVEATAWVGGSA